MLVTLFLVVLVAAIFIFFSQEFGQLFKKIFAIRGMKLFLPIALASWTVYTFDYWLLWILYYYRECLQAIVTFFSRALPFTGAYSIIEIVLLVTISVLPIFLLDVFLRRKRYVGYAYPYVTSSILWIVTAITLVVVGIMRTY